MQTLLDAVDADTDGVSNYQYGGCLVAYIFGDNFGGGTVTIEASPDAGTTWITCIQWDDSSGATATANGIILLAPLGGDVLIRATLTGATTPINVSVILTEVC